MLSLCLDSADNCNCGNDGDNNDVDADTKTAVGDDNEVDNSGDFNVNIDDKDVYGTNDKSKYDDEDNSDKH